MELKIFECTIFHKRFRPRENALKYKLFYLFDEIKNLKESAEKSKLFSFNKFNIFSFYNQDHGLRNLENPESWARNILKDYGFKNEEIHKIELLTLPRLFGHVFNPVSFWFCLDAANNLKCVISEVNNTFGETHSYVSFKEDLTIINKNDIITSKKLFHVSPFLKVEGEYKFRFSYENTKCAIFIDYFNNDGLMLTTSMVGKRVVIDDKTLLLNLFKYPFLTLKVIFLIHFQALKLVLKNIKYIKKPEQNKIKISK